ncbi:pirin family protein [Variovorax dokdonensis]|uniref:Pirin family protein n=1 Tax=Variovorax dokdonensis TaxID=344883 RepID=A0ABT7ND10_9BURK|nr:pirin family protein [Variovorax dokdonensis]MDM0045839.1 pirin family protein [Variovorax dokdonensis]
MQLLEPHQKDLGGGFLVRRLLPAASRRSVGPFVFFDHMGPVTEHEGRAHDVRPHPHIGLATVTYLFEGAMMHRDSIGSEQEIRPGAINWMTAGRGIVHSERKPDRLLRGEFVNHGLQLWAALPQDQEEVAPSFFHTGAADIPEVSEQGHAVRVLVGEAFGVRSPVATFAPTLYLDIQLPPGGSIELPPLVQEQALYVAQGSVTLDGEAVPPYAMVVLPEGGNAAVLKATADAPVRAVLVGGAALDGPRHMVWNFVSSRRERIAQAGADWEAKRFDKVPGETEFIPLPDHPVFRTPAQP